MRSHPKTKKRNFWLILKGRSAEIHKKISQDRCYLLLEEYMQGKLTSVNPCREIGKSFKESLQGVSLIYELKNILPEYQEF